MFGRKKLEAQVRALEWRLTAESAATRLALVLLVQELGDAGSIDVASYAARVLVAADQFGDERGRDVLQQIARLVRPDRGVQRIQLVVDNR